MASTISGSTGVTADTLVSTGTGALTLPVGTTAQRPGTAATGMVRYNTTLGYTEVYTGSSWAQVGSSYVIGSVLVIAGGAGGGYNGGGGGGAGGVVSSDFALTVGTAYTVTIGAGGAGEPSGNTLPGANGSISRFGTFYATGGGGGGSYVMAGVTGGSGGGGAGNPSSAGGSAISGQGFAGGTGNTDFATYGTGGGGGGASAAGAAATSSGGAGGAGVSSSITGSAVTYGGGGGGGASGGRPVGAGGAGGGGAGGQQGTSNGTAGTANTGGGGGGGGSGGNGGSGKVIISVPTSRYSGTYTGSPTITTSGSNTILQFNASGSYTA